MQKVILGKTGIEVSKNSFGALPIQRISKKDAVYLLQKAFYQGINYFDTARAYSDSEEKLGAAFSYIREKLIISTKTAAQTGEDLKKDLEESLRMLKTDYIDIYQFHNPAFCPKPGDGSGLYEAAEEAKRKERSSISASRTTGSLWQKRPSNPAFMKRCSSRFPIFLLKRIWRS